jgi:hypothetical protein
MGCAIATTATIADLTYEEVAFLANGASPEELRDTDELRRLLGSVTRIRWLGNCPRPLKTVEQTLFPGYPVAVLLQNHATKARFAQWVAARRELIHDPSLSACYRIRDYPYRHWYAVQLLEPAEPAELGRRKRPRADFVLRELAEQISFQMNRIENDHDPAA